MGLFGRKKDMSKTNENNKRVIISELTNAMQHSRGEATEILKELQQDMNFCGNSGSEEVTVIDGQILEVLQEVKAAVMKGQEDKAINKLDKLEDFIVERKVKCPTGGTLTKKDRKAEEKRKKELAKIMGANKKKIEASRAEELLDQVDDEQARLDSLQEKFEKLKTRAAKNWSAALEARGRSIQNKINQVQNRIAMINIELGREEAVEGAEDTESFSTALTTDKRRASDDKIQVLKDNIAAAQETAAATVAQTNDLNATLGQFSQISAGLQTQSFAATQQSSVFSSGAQTAGASSVFSSSGAQATGGSVFGGAGAQNAQTQYGGFDASKMGTAQMTNDINRTKASLQQSMDAYNDKIADVDDELRDLNAQLKPLLIKRKTASPSECVVLDGQIDQLNAKRNAVTYSIKRYRQALSQLQEQLSLIDKLATQQDLDATNAKIQQMTGGKFADFEGLAMFLKDSVAKSNEQLEEIGTAAMVADSEEINMNTFSGSSAVFSDTMGEKDEDKYGALERDLGLMI